MATQRLIPHTGLSLSMPLGDGRHESVDLPTEGVHPALQMVNEDSPANGYCYRRVADQLRGGDWWGPRRIFITSPTPGDGKTCTAFNLAWALNNRGASVLLVELNFTRPRFTNFLGGLQIRFGVDGAIRRQVHPSDSVFSMGSEMFGVAAVKSPMRPREFEEYQPHLVAYLNWASDNYDWLVLDCPPVISSAWNKWFRAHARPALLVVRELHTAAVQVRHATDRLGANLKGVLLNDVASGETSNGTGA